MWLCEGKKWFLLPLLLLLLLLRCCCGERSGRWRGHNNSKTSSTNTAVTGNEVVTVVSAEVGTRYRGRADADTEFHYAYNVNSLGRDRALRVRTEAEAGSGQYYPLRVEVRYNLGSLNWLVPFASGGVDYDEVERTLCLFEDDDKVETRAQEVTVVLSTADRRGVDFTVAIYEVDDFAVDDLGRSHTVRDVSASTPVVYFVDLGDTSDDHLLELRVESNDGDVCGMASLQPLGCPVADTEEAVRAETEGGQGSYQTMLKKAAFSVDKRKFEHGALLVFLVTATDATCGVDDGEVDPDKREKDFTFILNDGIETSRVPRLVGTSLGVLSVLCILAIVLSVFCSAHGKSKKIAKRVNRVHEKKRAASLTALNEIGKEDDDSDDAENGVQNAGEEDGVTSVRDVVDNFQRSSKDEVESRSYPKYVSELCRFSAKERTLGQGRKKFGAVFIKSELYAWLTATVAVFYGIPAFQLVLSHNFVLLDSGDQDLCYYNFYCAIPALVFSNFNNIFSNVYYFVFGCLFLVLVWHRQRQYTRFLERLAEKGREDADVADGVMDEYGVPQHFGLFNAMGLALIMEAFFSAFYHVCPSDENFQFDTTFMYIIASLSFLKIYQFRHPDITTSAYKVFFGIGLVLFSEALGIFYGSTAYWILTLIVYFFLIVCLTAILYHPGEWSFNASLFVQMYRSVRSRFGKQRKQRPKKKSDKKRLILVLLLLSLNLLMLLSAAIWTPDDAPSYILMIFIANLLAYVAYYLGMKIYHREKLTVHVYVYSVLALFSWGVALYYYNDRDTDTRLSPAQSRDLNRECVILDMYDHHDIWHMFSAMGLFHCFMLFLNLEDGIFDVPRNEIAVF